MEPAFTTEQYLVEFKELYPIEWQEIVEDNKYYSRKDETRSGRKFAFPPPEGYVLASTNLLRRNMRKKDDTDEMLAFEERNTLREEMLRSVIRATHSYQ